MRVRDYWFVYFGIALLISMAGWLYYGNAMKITHPEINRFTVKLLKANANTRDHYKDRDGVSIHELQKLITE